MVVCALTSTSGSRGAQRKDVSCALTREHATGGKGGVPFTRCSSCGMAACVECLRMVSSSMKGCLAEHPELRVMSHGVWAAMMGCAFDGGTTCDCFSGRGAGLGGTWTNECPLCIDQPLTGGDWRARRRGGEWALEKADTPVGDAEELDSVRPTLEFQGSFVEPASVPQGDGTDGPILNHSVEVCVYGQLLADDAAQRVLQGDSARGEHALYHSPPVRHPMADPRPRAPQRVLPERGLRTRRDLRTERLDAAYRAHLSETHLLDALARRIEHTRRPANLSELLLRW